MKKEELNKTIKNLNTQSMIPRSDIDKILILTRYDLHSQNRSINIEDIGREHFASSTRDLWNKAPYVIFADEGNKKKILKARI